MKALIISLVALLTVGISYGQLDWSDNIPVNPELLSTYTTTETVMYNNNVYQVFPGNGNALEISKFNTSTSQWSVLSNFNNSNYSYNIRSVIIGDAWFIAVTGVSSTLVFKFDFLTETFTQCPGSLPWVPDSNWIIKSTPGSTEFYLGYSVAGSSVYLSRFDAITETFNSADYTTALNGQGGDLTYSSVELYLSNSTIWMGISGASQQLVKATIGNISIPANYNDGGSNDGKIRVNSAPIAYTYFYYLTGDGQSEPYITVEDSTNSIGYEELLSDLDVNINTSTATANTFYTWQKDHESLEHPAYAFLTSPFSTVSNGSTYDKFYLYRKDNGTNVWDSVGPKLEFGIYDVTPNTLRLSLENSNQQHILVNYASTDGEYYFKVLNNAPSIISASENISASICGGHNNLIYPQLEIEDADMDHIQILSVTSSNGNVINAYAVPIGVDNSSSPGINKFEIYGFVQTQGNTDIVITYTDGFNLFTTTLPSVTLVGTAPNIVFTPSTLMLCSNENMINLNDYVNFVDHGVFNINGYPIENGVFDATELSQVMTGGSVNYTINVDGCIVQTGTSFAFVTPATASASTTSATCGNTDGTANVALVQGSSPNYTVEWSTGETASTISNLAPGAYYYNVTDEYGCHSTGFASVQTSTITVVETITPISCYGANDGGISVAVSGPATYTTLWSTGHASPFITNLGPGNYWVTVVDQSNNCTVTYDYMLTEPAKINASFSSYEPDCSMQNGNIYGVYTGGNGGYTFDWLTFGQTTADLYNVGYGIYQVEVTDNLGCKDTFEYILNDYQAIDILETIYPASCNTNNGAIMVSLMQDANGGPTFSNSVEWSNGATTISNGSISSGEYTMYVESGPSPVNSETCHSMKKMFVPIKAPIRQEICLVTVDTATTTNLVVWAKSEFYGIDHYNIYRENTVAGEFSLIDTVDFNSLSVFNDVVASPMDRSWRYKISQVNDCGIESPISVTHKTLHLNTIDIIPNQSVNIFWDDYEGPIGAAEYVVWRNTDQNGWEALSPTVPVGTTTFTDGTITGLTGLDYYIEMVLGIPCSAEKAQDFNTTRSNKDKGAFSSGNGTGNSNNELGEESIDFSIYPNPTDDELTISISENGLNKRVVLTSISGQLIESFNITELNQTISLQELAAGMYLIQIEGNNEQIKIVKQ